MSVLAGGCSIPIVLFLLLISSPSLVRCLWDIETNETSFESSLSTSTIETNLTKIQPDDDQSPKNVSSRSKSVFIDTNDFERLRQKLQILRIIQFRDQLLFSTNYLKLSNLTNAANEELFSSEAPQQIRFSYDLKSKVIRLLPQVTYLDSLYKFQPVYGLSSMLVISAQKIPSVKNLSTPLRDCLYPNIPILPPATTTTTTTTTTLAPTTRATTHKARTIHGRIKSKILRFSRKVRRTIKTTSTTTAALLNEIDLVDGKNSSLPLMRSIEIKENSQLNNDAQSFQVETFVYGVNSRSNSDSNSITMVSMSLICDRRSKDKNGALNSSSKYGFIFSDNCRAANMKSAEELEDHEEDDEDYEDEEPNHQKVSVIELGIDNRLLYSIVQIENETIFLARDDPNNPIEFKNYSGLHPNILIIPNLHRFWGSFYYRRYLNVLLPGNIIYRYSLTHINEALRTDQFLHSPDEMTTVDSIFGSLNWKDAILSLIANDHEIQRIFIKSEEEQTRLTIIAIILCVLLCLFVAILIFIAICISRDRGGGDDAKDDLYQEPSLSLTTSRPKGASKPLLLPGSRVKQPGQQYPVKFGQSMSKHAMKPYDMPTATNASDYMTVNDSNFDDIYKYKSAEDFVKTVNAVTATDDSRLS